MELKKCTECLSDIPAEAKICQNCGTRIEGVKCTDCASFCSPDAKVCKWCGKRLISAACDPNFKPFKIEGELFAVLFTEFSLFPQKVKFDADKIVITTYGFAALTSRDEEILWEKVAGFSVRSGLFWDAVVIETRGQSGGSIRCLSKKNSRKIREVLQNFEK